MVKKFFPSLAVFLTACVTVNIYFPAAAVQRAADRIVEETWGEQPKGGVKERPEAIPKSGSFLTRNAYAFAGFAAEAFAAQEPDINISNPAIRALKDSIRTRSESIKPFMDKGNVGIGRDGLLVVRTTEGLSLKERAEVQQLVEAENRDREALYAEIARANNFPVERVADIKKIFAKSWIEQARSGWMIQDPQGSWRKK
ncbi:MAG: YdbL family protein [Deltaproteobacteria bacterium]|nr:YdbL family protein [Deltaproteobacteria bacterium]